MPTAAIPERLKLTYEDYALLPADGKRHEIIDGEHIVTPAPNTHHQTAVVNLTVILGAFVREHRLGRLFVAPYDLVLTDFDIVQPDLLYFSNAHLSAITPANAQAAPDLAIEVLSPSTRKIDELAKRKLYERSGVQEYWIVDPELERIKIFRATEGAFAPPTERSVEADNSLDTPLLPGFQTRLAAIFEE